MEEVFKETKEEVKKVTKKMDEDLKKVTKKINEDLKKVTKQMNEKLEKLEDTIQQAQEELNMELRDLLGDGVKKMTEVDEKPLEHAMSCLKLEEALKDPADASVSVQVLNQRPKRVIKSTPRYK
ncbi:unnamed protein product [Eruca vesicaria subsp. sativa]|uniref:Uncharacterized protein n=1 Tax=Eruca vesicaria subsp. sativa TaxID=29727 RepID=A0ABC8JQW9_ERUVS|nr:unnamed protein product [Eruca vesicaria subsp. sativa]